MLPKKVILCGCNGHMGRVVSLAVSERNDCKIVAGVDLSNEFTNSFPVFQTPLEIEMDADVIIDFSHPSLLSSLLAFAVEKKIPAVLCSTGYSEVQREEIEKAAAVIPVFSSGNMSLGVNLLIELAKRAAVVLGKSFDIEIIEKHHNRKLDAPSGTALMIADGLSQVRDGETDYTYDRHSRRMKRQQNEIGIHSVRGGSIVGEHEILFAGPQETISITHTAQSREIFALGAINAALYLTRQPAGLYDMSHLLQDVK